MKYFVLFGILAFLAVMLFMPVLKFFVGRGYWEGLKVVPIVMAAELFMGVYFNLSFWYKLSDRTWWGAIMSGVGAAVMIAVNLFGVPRWGYMACAWGGFAGYGVAMLMSWFIGQRYYPVKYELNTMLRFLAVGILVYGTSVGLGDFLGVDAATPLFAWRSLTLLACNALLLGSYGYLIYRDLRG